MFIKINKKKIKISKPSGGFIIIEMMVAIALIILVLPASIFISTRAISVSSYQKNQMIATYLAQEGQELARSIRDANILSMQRGDGNVAWDDGFSVGKCATTACTIDITAKTLSAGSGNLTNLSSPPSSFYRLYTTASGFYSHTSAGGIPTPFYRGVFIAPAGRSDQVTVQSVVVWETPFGRREVDSFGFLTYWMR